MARRTHNGSDTRLIVQAIRSASDAAQRVAAAVSRELQTHTERDDERFAALTALAASIAADVKSLLESRTYTRGMVRMAVLVSGSVSTILVFLIEYFHKR